MAAVLFAATIRSARGQSDTPLFDRVRSAATINMVIVGVAFVLLLRDVDRDTLRPWINVVLHYVMPVVAVADPPAIQLRRADIL